MRFAQAVRTAGPEAFDSVTPTEPVCARWFPQSAPAHAKTAAVPTAAAGIHLSVVLRAGPLEAPTGYRSTTSLEVHDGAGQRARDALDDLNPGDHQPTELVHGLGLGADDHVVGAGHVLGAGDALEVGD